MHKAQLIPLGAIPPPPALNSSPNPLPAVPSRAWHGRARWGGGSERGHVVQSAQPPCMPPPPVRRFGAMEARPGQGWAAQSVGRQPAAGAVPET